MGWAWDFIFKGYRVSILKMKRVLWMDGGVGGTNYVFNAMELFT